MSKLHRLAFCIAITAIAVTAAQDASAYTYKVIHDFCSKRLCADGQTPMSGVVMDAAGNLYGTTQNGGSAFNGPGTAYELVPNAAHTKWKNITLYRFATNTGTHPVSTPILDVDGNLYGTTYDGGRSDLGVVYALMRRGTNPPRAFKTLSTFIDGGGNPIGGLGYQGAASGAPYDGSSPLYVAASTGSKSQGGILAQVFLNGKDWTTQLVYIFCAVAQCADGKTPEGTPLLDANGRIFGTTSHGGAAGQGVVYALANSGGTWTETIPHAFCQSEKCEDGAAPANALISDATGNLYGTTPLGGANRNGGTLFKLEPDGTYDVLYSFCAVRDCRDGVLPQSDLIMDSNGTLYGLTANGGGKDGDTNHAGGGTAFALSGSTLQTLYRFCAQENCRDGEYPVGGLIMDAQGNLFGTTSQGGKYGAGVVFELSP